MGSDSVMNNNNFFRSFNKYYSVVTVMGIIDVSHVVALTNALPLENSKPMTEPLTCSM